MKLSGKARVRAATAAVVLLGLGAMAAGLAPQSAHANAAQAAAGAAATSDANRCGAQFKGAPLYNCLGGAMDKLASRIDGEGNIGKTLAGQIRTAAAAIRTGKKQESVAALSYVRSTISGFIGRMKGKGRDETPGMNSLSGAISTTIRLIQTKG
jgi:hypothetical protein